MVRTSYSAFRGVGLKGAKIDGLEARLGSSLPSSSDPSKDQLDGFVSLYQQGKYEEALVIGKAYRAISTTHLFQYSWRGSKV